MPTVLQGTYTIAEVLKMTSQSKRFKNRFKYRKRDRIQSIQVKTIAYLQPDRRGAPSVRYEVRSQSKPRYKPYLYKSKSGRWRRRNITHEYDIVFNADRLSINTRNWSIRLGSGKKWNKSPPQNQVKSVYRENRRRWSREQIAKHKRRKNLYLDVGDWNSRVKGINGDWLFRFAYVYKANGHLFGRDYNNLYPPVDKNTNPNMIFALPKHLINFFEVLMIEGVLKDD